MNDIHSLSGLKKLQKIADAKKKLCKNNTKKGDDLQGTQKMRHKNRRKRERERRSEKEISEELSDKQTNKQTFFQILFMRYAMQCSQEQKWWGNTIRKLFVLCMTLAFIFHVFYGNSLSRILWLLVSFEVASATALAHFSVAFSRANVLTPFQNECFHSTTTYSIFMLFHQFIPTNCFVMR